MYVFWNLSSKWNLDLHFSGWENCLEKWRQPHKTSDDEENGEKWNDLICIITKSGSNCRDQSIIKYWHQRRQVIAQKQNYDQINQPFRTAVTNMMLSILINLISMSTWMVCRELKTPWQPGRTMCERKIVVSFLVFCF